MKILEEKNLQGKNENQIKAIDGNISKDKNTPRDIKAREGNVAETAESKRRLFAIEQHCSFEGRLSSMI